MWQRMKATVKKVYGAFEPLLRKNKGWHIEEVKNKCADTE
jgi:hypothetical protein